MEANSVNGFQAMLQRVNDAGNKYAGAISLAGVLLGALYLARRR